MLLVGQAIDIPDDGITQAPLGRTGTLIDHLMICLELVFRDIFPVQIFRVIDARQCVRVVGLHTVGTVGICPPTGHDGPWINLLERIPAHCDAPWLGQALVDPDGNGLTKRGHIADLRALPPLGEAQPGSPK